MIAYMLPIQQAWVHIPGFPKNSSGIFDGTKVNRLRRIEKWHENVHPTRVQVTCGKKLALLKASRRFYQVMLEKNFNRATVQGPELVQ